MLEKIRFILSGIGSFLWPLIKQFMLASAPLIQAAASSAVVVVANRYADKVADDAMKAQMHNDAVGLIRSELERQGLKIGQDFFQSMIDVAIKAAVKNLKEN